MFDFWDLIRVYLFTGCNSYVPVTIYLILCAQNKVCIFNNIYNIYTLYISRLLLSSCLLTSLTTIISYQWCLNGRRVG